MKCAKACGECAHALRLLLQPLRHLVIEGKKDHARTMGTCNDCGLICGVSAALSARGGPLAVTQCDSCAKACDICAAACEKFPDDKHMAECARGLPRLRQGLPRDDQTRPPLISERMKEEPSFPRSAWERTSGRSASCPPRPLDATQSVADVRSHAERENEGSSSFVLVAQPPRRYRSGVGGCCALRRSVREQTRRARVSVGCRRRYRFPAGAELRPAAFRQAHAGPGPGHSPSRRQARTRRELPAPPGRQRSARGRGRSFPQGGRVDRAPQRIFSERIGRLDAGGP